MPKPKKTETAAILTIRGADNMTPKGRRQIANWLRHQAETFAKDGSIYASRFTARYTYLR